MSQTPEELEQKIKAAREKQGEIPSSSQPSNYSAEADRSALGRGLRASTDLAAGIFVGGFMGYWLDQWLGTKPVFMIILFFAGFGAGLLNIYRSQMGEDYKVGFKDDKTKKE